MQIKRKEIIYYQNIVQNELTDMLDMLPVTVGQEHKAKRPLGREGTARGSANFASHSGMVVCLPLL